MDKIGNFIAFFADHHNPFMVSVQIQQIGTKIGYRLHYKVAPSRTLLARRIPILERGT
jgi:hypothetical protein